MAHYTTRPVHQPTIEKYDEIDSIGNQWTRPGNFIGNGPYILEDWQLNKITKKSPNYWDADRVTIQEIHFFPVVDNVTREDRCIGLDNYTLLAPFLKKKLRFIKKNIQII